MVLRTARRRRSRSVERIAIALHLHYSKQKAILIMTQAQVKYPAIFSPDENYRKPALRAMARTFSLDTDYKNDLIYAYDTIQAWLKYDRHFDPSQAELLLALFGQPRLASWLSRLEKDFCNHEAVLHWEITNNWEVQQGLDYPSSRFLGFSFYLFPKVGASPLTDFEDDEFPLIQEYIDTIYGPFLNYCDERQSHLDWMFDEVKNQYNPKFFNTRQSFSQRGIAKLNKPAHHKPLSEVLKGVL